MKRQEHILPDGYREVKHINAKDATFGLIMNVVALLVMLLFAAIGVIALVLANVFDFVPLVEKPFFLATFGVFLLSMIVYIVLHELVHGIAYKVFTHEKLTFGMSWSCAFCGVPGIYVYRTVSLIALLAPFLTFTLLLLPLTIGLFFVNPTYALFSCILLGMHVGGCSGDLYMTFLLLFRYKSPATLIRDTGPEQFIYLPEGDEIQFRL